MCSRNQQPGELSNSNLMKLVSYCLQDEDRLLVIPKNYNAKLFDFRLAKGGPTGDKSHVSTRVMGTCDYGNRPNIDTVAKMLEQFQGFGDKWDRRNASVLNAHQNLNDASKY
ncbi:hypothetical protein PTKIN_Ptkin05aG0132500 [Pterospermum kingtungense]